MESGIESEDSSEDETMLLASGGNENVPDLLESFSSVKSWQGDPLNSLDWDAAGPPSNLCSGRIKRDIASLFTDPLPGIFPVPEDGNLMNVHCLIIGPLDTPYEGGFFHFLIRFGPQYPLHPPRIRFMSTGGGSVRFNPNLYSCGKVCLSILGTWSGPAWSPASNLSSMLLSLQSLLNERPYHNEPGYEDRESNYGDSDCYSRIIQHETVRVAVCEQLEGNFSAPNELLQVMKSSFLDFYDHYVNVCQTNLELDGSEMKDPFKSKRGNFQYKSLLTRLKQLKEKIESDCPQQSRDEVDTSSLSDSDEAIAGAKPSSLEDLAATTDADVLDNCEPLGMDDFLASDSDDLVE